MRHQLSRSMLVILSLIVGYPACENGANGRGSLRSTAPVGAVFTGHAIATTRRDDAWAFDRRSARRRSTYRKVQASLLAGLRAQLRRDKPAGPFRGTSSPWPPVRGQPLPR